jgi:hypothetical protein
VRCSQPLHAGTAEYSQSTAPWLVCEPKFLSHRVRVPPVPLPATPHFSRRQRRRHFSDGLIMEAWRWLAKLDCVHPYATRAVAPWHEYHTARLHTGSTTVQRRALALVLVLSESDSSSVRVKMKFNGHSVFRHSCLNPDSMPRLRLLSNSDKSPGSE